MKTFTGPIAAHDKWRDATGIPSHRTDLTAVVVAPTKRDVIAMLIARNIRPRDAEEIAGKLRVTDPDKVWVVRELAALGLFNPNTPVVYLAPTPTHGATLRGDRIVAIGEDGTLIRAGYLGRQANGLMCVRVAPDSAETVEKVAMQLAHQHGVRLRRQTALTPEERWTSLPADARDRYRREATDVIELIDAERGEPAVSAPRALRAGTRLWEVEHAGHMAGGDFFLPQDRADEVDHVYGSWQEFIDSGMCGDPAESLVIRWDWHSGDGGPDRFEVHWVIQGKALLQHATIDVTPGDEPTIRTWLTIRACTVAALWRPVEIAKQY